jgi:methylated-DNA-[protein]-cysteine S-methyltransferase
MTHPYPPSMLQLSLETALGSLFLIGSDRGLAGLYWRPQELPLNPRPDPRMPGEALLLRASGQIAEYLAGKRQAFDLPLDLSGTPFQEKVWKALLDIPYGATVSYQRLAERIGKPAAARAVGTACGKNPVCLIVPCHRVVATGGGLGGYAGGLPAKERLLAMEGAWPRPGIRASGE